MLAERSKTLIIFLFVIMMVMPISAMSLSNVWYASLMDKYFHSGVFLHNIKYSHYLSKDITNFDVSVDKINIGFRPALQIKGTVKIGNLPSSAIAVNGKYMLFLQAYLISSNGKIIWQQQGFPKNNSWMNANGDTASFLLINNFNGSTDGATLLIIAGGDPIISGKKGVRAILGIKKIDY